VWTEFRPEQIATFYNRPSLKFSESQKPKTAWTMSISNKKDTEPAMNKETENQSGFPLALGWALKENMKFGNKGAEKRMTKKVIQYLQGYFLADNLRAEDRYLPEAMHADLENLAAIGELTFKEIPTVKTIKS
ncbi:27775_t:CDS:2, partial [Racocetra persica]